MTESDLFSIIGALVCLILLALLAGCSDPFGPDSCRFRVVVLPDETRVEAVHRSIPEEIRHECGADLRIEFVVIG